MAYSPDNGPPLGPSTREALGLIIAATDPDDGIERDSAEELLVGESFTEEDAEWAIQRLIENGYCYVVEGELFVTDREILDDRPE